ncbi:hypothetical protein BABINDRAFT_163604 [Babjeviella inositovora NRRL Y-12698]|uniref:Uncharacterized protein n=1 Tax=Babjeviella inositovora NRRL Y-12698 TaxID=984486 RepID=A0A1E3QK19_9ASCO|nr:uncharacterized protein BABINDRAFT_163604 [Babjeviella inositovora NRRL Y-12698]ODQ77347.1 hypothetical protein BABINDRAFT_163604 [Babjeviella inositovora NRRL Y-12698]
MREAHVVLYAIKLPRLKTSRPGIEIQCDSNILVSHPWRDLGMIRCSACSTKNVGQILSSCTSLSKQSLPI